MIGKAEKMVPAAPKSYLMLALLAMCACWISSVSTDVLITVPTSPESTSSITVSFSEFLFGSFHQCLCNGTTSKCVAEYDKTLAALRIHRDPGFFQYDDISESKIYACRNVISTDIDRPVLECIRIPGENCAPDLNVRFFRLDGVQACHSQCIGILLQKGESMETQNVTYVNSCSDGCAHPNLTTSPSSDIRDTVSTVKLASSYGIGIDTSFTSVPITIHPSNQFFTSQLVSINTTNILKLSTNIENTSPMAFSQIMPPSTEMYTASSDPTTNRSTTLPKEFFSISTEPLNNILSNIATMHSSQVFSNAVPHSTTTMPLKTMSYQTLSAAGEEYSTTVSSIDEFTSSHQFVIDTSVSATAGIEVSNQFVFSTPPVTAEPDFIEPTGSKILHSSFMPVSETRGSNNIYSSTTIPTVPLTKDISLTQDFLTPPSPFSHSVTFTTTSSYTTTPLFNSTKNAFDSTRFNMFTVALATAKPLHTASSSKFAPNSLNTKVTPSASVVVTALNPSSTENSTVRIAGSENTSSVGIDMLYVTIGITLGIFIVVMIILIVVLAVKLHKEEVKRRQTALLEHPHSVHSDNESPVDVSPLPEFSVPSTSSVDLVNENVDVQYAFVNKAYKPGSDKKKSTPYSVEILDQQRNEQTHEDCPTMSYSPLSGHYNFMTDTADDAEDDVDSFSDESSLSNEDYPLPLDESRSSLKQVSFQNPISEEIVLDTNEDTESESIDSIVNFPFASMENFDLNDDDNEANDNGDDDVEDEEGEDDYPIDHFHFETPDNESLDHMPCECVDRSGTDPLAFTRGHTGIDDLIFDNDDA